MRRIIGRAAAVLPAIVLGGLIALAGPSGPAAAASVGTVTIGLSSPQVTCSNGSCQYVVTNCSVTVTNLTSQDLSLPVPSAATVPGSITWTAPNGDSGTVSTSAIVIWPNPVNGYAAIAPGASVTTTSCRLSVTLPQEATNAQLTMTVTVYPGVYPNLGSAETISGTITFLQNGSPLPVGLGVGAPVVAVGMGVLLLMLQRRRRRARTSLPARSGPS